MNIQTKQTGALTEQIGKNNPKNQILALFVQRERVKL